jgi:hypothetical protein
MDETVEDYAACIEALMARVAYLMKHIRKLELALLDIGTCPEINEAQEIALTALKMEE